MKNLGNVFILGDSYSTFDGANPPDCLTYYRTDGTNDTDVDCVEKTWWHQLISETGSNLIMNSSYSGSTVCNTGYNKEIVFSASFVSRFESFAWSRFFIKNKIDTIIVFGGTNDSWADSPIGELKYEGWDKAKDLYSFCPALTFLFNNIKTAAPEARVISVLNYGLKPEINQAMEKACEHYGIELIKLTQADKENDHPTAKGMTEIKNMIIEKL